MRKFIPKLLSIILLLPAYAWSAEDNSNNDRSLHLMTPVYTYHYKKSNELKSVWFVGLEEEYTNNTLAGVAISSNSSGVLSTYVYR